MNDATYLQDAWPNLDQSEKRKIVESITNKIVIGKREVEIDLCYLPSSKRHVKKGPELHGSNPQMCSPNDRPRKRIRTHRAVCHQPRAFLRRRTVNALPHDRTSIRCRAVDTKFRQSLLIAAFDAFETSAVAYDVIQIREFPHRFVFKSFARASVYLARRVYVIFDRPSSDSE